MRNWDKYLFFSAIALIVFGYGIAVGKYKLFPYEILNDAKDAGIDWKRNWEPNLGLKPKHINPARKPRSQWKPLNIEGETSPGVTLIPSFMNETNGIKLIDMDGKVIHQWNIVFSNIWPNPTHLLHGVLRDWDIQVDDAILQENGDIIFALSKAGMARLDRCGNVKWTVDAAVHHSIFQDSEQNFWVLASKVTEATKRLPYLPGPIDEEFILKISQDGKILREISFLDAIYKSGLHALLFTSNGGAERLDGWEITHLNDVEILEPDLSGMFLQFNEGDIMVSARNISLVAVIDGETEKIKWYKIGPYFRQHDPDFRKNGKISLFDNQSDSEDGAVFGGSRILEIDPVTMETTVLYEGSKDDPFYTTGMGAHQVLPNGNMLLTEAELGRVFEITPEGKKVWEFIDYFSENEVIEVFRAQRFPLSFGEFAKETCR